MEIDKYILTKSKIIKLFCNNAFIYTDNALTKTTINKELNVITRHKLLFKKHQLLYAGDVYVEHSYSVLNLNTVDSVFETLTITPVELDDTNIEQLKLLAGI